MLMIEADSYRFTWILGELFDRDYQLGLVLSPKYIARQASISSTQLTSEGWKVKESPSLAQ